MSGPSLLIGWWNYGPSHLQEFNMIMNSLGEEVPRGSHSRLANPYFAHQHPKPESGDSGHSFGPTSMPDSISTMEMNDMNGVSFPCKWCSHFLGMKWIGTLQLSRQFMESCKALTNSAPVGQTLSGVRPLGSSLKFSTSPAPTIGEEMTWEKSNHPASPSICPTVKRTPLPHRVDFAKKIKNKKKQKQTQKQTH